MVIKCLTCGSKISRTWLFLGLPWSRYTCSQCGSIFCGTIPRLVINSVAVGATGYFLIPAIKGKVSPFLLLPLIGLALVLFFVDLPWQIKKAGNIKQQESPE